jgi:hypothetical protein
MIWRTMKTKAIVAAELLLFLFAFLLLVPPVPSDAQIVPKLAPALITGGGSYGLSLWIAVKRKAEHLPTAALRLAFYFVLSWTIRERVCGIR